MSTAVQFRRGTTTEHASFTGAVGEITVDVTKDTVVVHDGTTVGGHPLAKQNGSNATGTWNIDISGNASTATSATTSTSAGKLSSTNWVVEESGGVLYFKYGGTNKAKLDSSGNLVVIGNVTAYGTV